MSLPSRTIVVVSGDVDQALHLEDLLIGTTDYDVIFLESIAHGYSRIKQVTPDFVIVVMDIDDVAACQLLSMLKIDEEVCGIPLLTCATRCDDNECEDEIGESNRDSLNRMLTVSTN